MDAKYVYLKSIIYLFQPTNRSYIDIYYLRLQ